MGTKSTDKNKPQNTRSDGHSLQYFRSTFVRGGAGTNKLGFISIAPINGATNVGIGTTITLNFTSAPTRGTGTITVRSGSAEGSIIESFDAASSGRISVVGSTWNLTPTSTLAPSTSIFTVIPSTAISNYVGLNITGADSHSFTTKALGVGDPYEGGYLICRAASINWIVAPASSEVSRNFYNRNDANTRAQQVSGCTGWFVPTQGQLQNPGYVCRTYWDSYSTTLYMTSTQGHTDAFAQVVYFTNGGATCTYKTSIWCVRSFRCVTY